VVVTTSVWVGSGQLGIAKRTRQRNEATQHPRHHEPPDISGDTSNHGRGFENAGTNDNANNDGDRTKCAQPASRLAGSVGG